MIKYKRIVLDGKYYAQFTYKKTLEIISWSSKTKITTKNINNVKKTIRLREKSIGYEREISQNDNLKVYYVYEKYKTKKTFTDKKGNKKDFFHIKYQYETRADSSKEQDKARKKARDEILQAIKDSERYEHLDLDDFEQAYLTRTEKKMYGEETQWYIDNIKNAK